MTESSGVRPTLHVIELACVDGVEVMIQRSRHNDLVYAQVQAASEHEDGIQYHVHEPG
jgi:hypothetical protein